MSLFVASWFAAVVAFRSSLVILLILLLDGVPSWVSINRLLCCLIVVDSTIPINVVGMKSGMNSPFYHTFVPVRVSINKLNLAPNKNMPY